MRVVAGIASAGVLAVTVAAGSVTLAANHFEGNITTIDISDQVGERAIDYGDLSHGSVSILVMGSDSREGKGNTGYGKFEGARSDTTMLLHLYPDRKSAVVLSIPRDTVTQLPSCKSSTSGATLAPVTDRFNASFSRGGPGCTVKSVEKLTGITVDHFVVVDFNGFKRTVNALGGVPVCLTRPVQDRQSGLDLPAGRTVVKGEDALAFMRVRHNIGDGSDISRINRQQLFMSSMVQQVTSSGLITDPLRLYRVLDQVTKSLSTDKALADSKGVVALARSLTGLKAEKITFVTLPWVPNPADPNTVVVDQAKAKPILDALRTDKPWPAAPTKGADGKRLTVAPSSITVDVHNATGAEGQASAAARGLSANGFHVGITDARSPSVKRTTIRYAPDQLEAARTLQAAVRHSVLKESATQGSHLDLTLGTSYTGVRTIKVSQPKSSTGSSGSTSPGTGGTAITADQDICTG